MLNKLYIITLFILIFGQLSSISKQSGLNIYMFDVFVILFSFVGLLYFLAVKRSLKITFWHFLGSAFIIWGFITLIFSLNVYGIPQFILGSFYVLRFFGYLLSSLILYNMYIKKMMSPDKVIDLLVLSGVILSFFGFIQLIFLPDFKILDPSLGWDPHVNRLASTFFDPNFTGAYLVMIFAIIMNKIYAKKNFTPFYITSFIIIVLSIFLTFSRSSWGMLSIVVMVFGLFKYKKLLFLFILIAFSTYFAIPRVQTRITGTTDPADSAAFRIVSWSNTLEIIEDNFLLGVGYNVYRYAQEDYGFLSSQQLFDNSSSGSDSSILFVLATTGIFGLGLFILFFTFPAVYSLVKKNESSVIIISLTLGLLMESQFINSLFYPQIMFLWFSIVVSYLFYTQH